MIISRTPFRISFFGGGTDYPAWFQENGGSVLSVTINKYCYIFCRYLPPFFNNKHRIVWSRVENVSDLEEIQHPSVRECMRFMKIKEGLEIHHDGDLPARAGLGSSSSFTVGMLHSLHTLLGEKTSHRQLAEEAIHVEHHLIRESVGYQDQVAAAYGGLNQINFGPGDSFCVEPVQISEERLQLFQSHLLLIFTGISRTASEIAKDKIKVIPDKKSELSTMREMVPEALKLLSSGDSFKAFGELLHESWKLKRTLSSRVSTPHLDTIYERALNAGAYGGKILGAGGGGFMLLMASPDRHTEIKKQLAEFLAVPFSFETRGSHILFGGKSTEL